VEFSCGSVCLVREFRACLVINGIQYGRICADWIECSEQCVGVSSGRLPVLSLYFPLPPTFNNGFSAAAIFVSLEENFR
jgi:hypothetical protein